MRSWMKICLTLGLSCLLLGGIAGTAGYFMGGQGVALSLTDGFRLRVVDTRNRSTASEILTPFHTLDIEIGAGKLILCRGGDQYTIETEYPDGAPVDYEVEDGVLTVSARERKVFFSLGPCEQTVIVNVPESAQLREVTACSGMGSLNVSGLSAGYAKLTSNMGDVTLEQSNINELHMDADMGELVIQNTTTRKATLDANMGSIEAVDFTVEKTLDFDCDMGSVTLIGSFADVSGDCGMGSVTMSTNRPEDQYSFDLKCDMGSITLNGRGQGTKHNLSVLKAPYTIELDCDMGSITLETEK